MPRSIFGWDYPPGCSGTPWDEPDPPCGICGQLEDDCVCPECPECGGVGDPHCYDNHSLVRSFGQVALKAEADRLIEEENKRLNDDYTTYLEEQALINELHERWEGKD